MNNIYPQSSQNSLRDLQVTLELCILQNSEAAKTLKILQLRKCLFKLYKRIDNEPVKATILTLCKTYSNVKLVNEVNKIINYV